MTDEKLEKAQTLKSGVLQAEDFIERLKLVDRQSGCFIRFGKDDRSIYLPEELAEQVINEIIDFYKEKKVRCAKEFDEL
jgi:hypothetical protein